MELQIVELILIGWRRQTIQVSDLLSRNRIRADSLRPEDRLRQFLEFLSGQEFFAQVGEDEVSLTGNHEVDPGEGCRDSTHGTFAVGSAHHAVNFRSEFLKASENRQTGAVLLESGACADDAGAGLENVIGCGVLSKDEIINIQSM